MINNTIINLAQKLIKQPSVTPNDYSCQKIIINYLKKLNFYTESMCFDDTKNIWAYHQGCKKITFKKQHTLLFLGHTDVVSPGNIENWKYPPFSGFIDNGILYGRGAADMKGSIAAMLVATKKFIQKYPNHKNRIAFLFTSDEEGSGLNGTVKVVESLLIRNEHIDYCIIGEPSSKIKIGDIIKNGRRGSYTGRLIIPGIPGHVAYSEFLKNPIHLAIPALLDMLNNIKWDKKKSLLFPSTSMQFTNIYTDSVQFTNNVTPNQLKINFNFRFNDQSSVYNIKKKINKILLLHNLHKYIIDQEKISEPYWSIPGKLTNIVIKIIKNYQNINPILETSGGTSDGRFIIKMGSEIIELGATNRTIHKANECVSIADLDLLCCIYLEIMEKILL